VSYADFKNRFTVIDEADEMLDHDWSEELQKIMAGGDTNEDADHVYIMTSATFPKGVRKLANEYMSSDFTREC
jgi:ATP-dependent RNA helicase DDX3X